MPLATQAQFFSYPNPTPCNVQKTITNLSCPGNGLAIGINVNGVSGAELGTDVLLKELHINIQHDWVSDLVISLTSPDGTTVLISENNGGPGDNYGIANSACDSNTVFINNAFSESCQAVDIQNSLPPFLGFHLPQESFATFHNDQNPNGQWLLEICDNNQFNTGTFEYAELVFEENVCLPPNEISVADDFGGVFTFEWINNTPNPIDTIIEYGLPGFVPGTNGAAAGGTIATNQQVTGLTANTTYDLYVRLECEPGVFSDNSCAFQFTAPCTPSVPDEAENFSTQATCPTSFLCDRECDLTGFWQNTDNDAMNWLVQEGPTPTGNTGPDTDSNGDGKYVYIESSGPFCSEGASAFLVSPLVLVDTIWGACEMAFDYHLFGSQIGSLELAISTDCGDNWLNIFSISGNLGNEWQTAYLDLDAYDGMEIQLRFSGVKGNGFRGDIGLDNIRLYGISPGVSPVFTYFLDNDNDGFGDNAQIIQSCDPIVPAGFVTIGDDCNDNNPQINPAAPEIPCNFQDDNCNGPFDETELPMAVANDVEICEGETPVLTATSANPQVTYLWYENEDDFFPVHQGSSFEPSSFTDLTLTQTEVFFYYVATAVPPFCTSMDRTQVAVIVSPNPDLVAQSIPDVCMGNTINLLDFISDTKGTFGTLECYDETGNLLSNCLVTIEGNTQFGIKKTSFSGCTDSLGVTVGVKPSPEAQIEGDNTICVGDSDFLQGFDTGQGVAPLDFSWNTGQQGAFEQIFGGDTGDVETIYSFTVTGNNGCSDTDTFIVSSIESITSVSISKEDISFCSGNDGSISGTITGGIPPFSIEYSGTATGIIIENDFDFSIENLTQGAYSIEISDASGTGCSFLAPLTILNGPGAIVTGLEIIEPTCNGASNGQINIAVDADDIVWSTGSNEDTLTNLFAGFYNVTIFDGNCTTVIDSIFVGQPQEISVNLIENPIACAEDTNASILTNVAGGTAPYSYLWNSGDTTSNLENLSMGTFKLTVTDTNGCTLESDSVELTSPMALSFTENITMPTCAGANNGNISISPSGGTFPFHIEWSNGVEGFDNSFLVANTYSFTLEDGNGCTLVDSISLSEPPPIEVIPFKNDATCNGFSDGSINLITTGGTGFLSIQWNTGQTTSTIDNLAEGGYFAFIEDDNFCAFITDTITIEAPELAAIDFVVEPAFCEGVNDGKITAIISDGKNYDFQWAHDPTIQDSVLNGLPPDLYTLTATDEQGCLTIENVELSAPERIQLVTESISSACENSQTGMITLNVSGDHPLFTVDWSTGLSEVVSDQAILSNLAAGNYAVTVTDEEECIKIIDNLVIGENLSININVIDVIHNNCFGEDLGKITVDVTGGDGDYTYLWSNNSGNEPFSENLVAGTYQLTVSDANGCVAESQPIVITQPSEIQFTNNLTDVGNCDPDLVDSLCLFVSGGVPGYTYQWSNGSTSACLIGQPVGEYEIIITDAVGCSVEVAGLKIPDPAPELLLLPETDSLFLDCPDSQEDFTVFIDGGTAPFQFIWSQGLDGDTGADSLLLQNLDAGANNVTVTDAKGCVAVTDSFYVFRPDSIDLLITEIENVSCKGGTDGKIFLNINGGTTPYNISWKDQSADTLLTNDPNLINVPFGFYEVEIRDGNNCLAGRSNIEVIEPDELLNVLPINRRDSICFGATNGFIDISPSGGYPPYEYEWSNGAATQDIFTLGPGNYGLTMTDDEGCTFLLPDIQIIEADTGVIIELVQLLNPSCANVEDGLVDIEVSGSWPPYDYQWIPTSLLDISFEQDIEQIGAATYTVFVSDDKNCVTDPQSFTLVAPSPLLADVSRTNLDIENLTADVKIKIEGGTPPYNVLWSDMNTDSIRVDVPFGDYEVLVSDFNGCEFILDFVVDGVTSTAETTANSGWKIYPNPATDFLFVELDQYFSEGLNIEMYDLTGKKVFSHRKKETHVENIELDVSSLPSGIYQLILKIPDQPNRIQRVILMD